MKRMALIGGLVLSAAGLAYAGTPQDAGNSSTLAKSDRIVAFADFPRPPGADRDFMAPPRPPDRDRAGPPSDMPGPGQSPMPDMRTRLAATLSATETLVGIRSDQLDAWRDYTSALLEMTDEPARPSEPDVKEKDAKPLFAEIIADRLIGKEAAARKLKAAVDVLKQKLSPEQLKILREAEPAGRPHRQAPSRPPHD